MKSLLIALLSFTFLQSSAQVKQITINVPSSQYGTMPALLYKPTQTGNLPLLIFCHGKGESKAPLSNIYNNSSSGGPAYFIERGFAPNMYVLSPQAVGSDWSVSGSNLEYIIKYMVANYPIDPTRIYLTGLSAGGDGLLQYVTGFFTYKVVAIVPMSEAHGESPASEVQKLVTDNVKVWGFGDPNNDVHGYNTKKLVDDINKLHPAQANFTSYTGGHCCWNNFYNPTYKLNGQTIYDWMLQYSTTGSAPPVVPPVQSSGKRKYLQPGYQNGVYYDGNLTKDFLPGDTVVLKPSIVWGPMEFHNLHGKPGQRIVFISDGGQVLSKGYVKFYDCSDFHLDFGTGGTYLLKIQPHLSDIDGSYEGSTGVSVDGVSKNYEVNGVFVNHTVFGMTFKIAGQCDTSKNYPNLILDSTYIHDNRIQRVVLEGMYIGDTQPDNKPGANDPRPQDCNGTTIYPRPARLSNNRVENNIVDSTGRGGIQVAGASGGNNTITGNIVRHSGMNGSESQGAGISVGLYYKGNITGNTVINTLTWGIASLGGSSTNNPLVIENNNIDSSGFLYAHDNVNEHIWPITPTTPVYPPGANLNFVNAIYAKTVANDDKDSTIVWIKNNKIGKQKNTGAEIQIMDYEPKGWFQYKGNIICANTVNGNPARISTSPNFKYSSACGVAPPIDPVPPVPTVVSRFVLQLMSDGFFRVKPKTSTTKTTVVREWNMVLYSDGALKQQ